MNAAACGLQRYVLRLALTPTLLTVVLLSFTVPKIYELKKHEIDSAAHTGYKKVRETMLLML